MKLIKIQFKKVIYLVFCLTMLCSVESRSQEEASAHEFNIEDYSWLVGHWKGSGFGGTSEEIWTSPVDGTMMGMFRQINDGKIVFYEFLLLNKDGLHLKHFHPDLKGWEEKDEYLTFDMVGGSDREIKLKGLTFEKKSDTEMDIRLRMKRGDVVETEVFEMKKMGVD